MRKKKRGLEFPYFFFLSKQGAGEQKEIFPCDLFSSIKKAEKNTRSLEVFLKN
jgi:hypothetical protein